MVDGVLEYTGEAEKDPGLIEADELLFDSCRRTFL